MGGWRPSGRWCRLVALVAIGVFLFDLVVFNVLLYYAYGLVREVDAALKHHNPIDGISDIGVLRSAIKSLKEGGISRLKQETLGRVFLRSHQVPSWLRTNTSGDTWSFFGVDVSHSGEASFIMKRMLSQPLERNAHRLVVDIGANDGLMSSNSYNFIEMGWDAVLVDPLQKQLDIAAMNLHRFREPVTNRKPNVRFVHAVIGESDGEVELAVGQDAVDMESHLVDKFHPQYPGQEVIRVKSLTVASLVRENNIPKRFGLLSIDAEGVGDKILKQFMDLGCRPSYIIYETLHLSFTPAITRNELFALGYRLLTHRGWNHIFEYGGKELRRKATTWNTKV